MTKFHVNNMAVYMGNILKIKKHAQVKAILALEIEFLSSCFLIHYMYTVHTIVVKLDDVRTRNRNALLILSYIHQHIAQVRFKILLEIIPSSDP